jgi:hypothetical protein
MMTAIFIGPNEIDAAFAAMEKARANAVVSGEHDNWVNLNAGGATRKLDLIDERFRERIGSVAESSNTAHIRKHVVQ